MSSQDEFTKTYITSTEIVRRLNVTRSAVVQARQKGQLPDPILVENYLVIWKREAIEPHIIEWEKRRKERIGV